MTRGAVFAGGFTSAIVAWLSGEHGLSLFALAVTCLVASLCPKPGLDPERFFCEADKKILRDRANSLCEKCGVLVHHEYECPVGECPADMQADHKYPHSKGGRTILSNGACLCRRCNTSKGARV